VGVDLREVKKGKKNSNDTLSCSECRLFKTFGRDKKEDDEVLQYYSI